MMKRGAAWLAFGLAVGVAALGFFSREHEHTSVERADVSAAPDPLDASAELELGESAYESPMKAEAVRSEESTAPQRTPFASEAPDVSGGPWLRVISRSDGSSIPNAAVYWNDASVPGFEPTMRALGPDHARGPWPAGTQRFTTAEDGHVQLPKSQQRVDIAVFAPGRAGLHAYKADWSAVITIALTDVFYARVVTAAGEPVTDATVSSLASVGVAKTDATGRVALELWASRTPEQSSKLALVVRRSLADDLRFEFPADEPRDSWKTLELPRDGSLRVNVPDAEAMLGKSSGQLRVSRINRHPPPVTVALVDGTALVPAVPLEVEYDVSVEFDGVSGWLTTRVPGPHRNGDGNVVHELRCADHSFAVLRLVDAQARPIANTQVVADINAHRPPASEKAFTDAQGKFYVLLEDHFAPGEPRRLWLDVPGKLTIGMELPGVFVPGVVDLGTVRLETDESADKSPRPRAPGGRNVK